MKDALIQKKGSYGKSSIHNAHFLELSSIKQIKAETVETRKTDSLLKYTGSCRKEVNAKKKIIITWNLVCH